MDFSIEIAFVKRCVKKEYQDRLSFELQSKKHREKAISRFAHSAELILKNEFINLCISDLESYFSEKMDIETCYIISDDSHDGDKLLLKEAIEFCQTSYMTVILISSKFIAVKEEFEKKQPLLFVFKIN